MKRYLTWGLMPMVLFGVLAVFFWRGLSLNPSDIRLYFMSLPVGVKYAQKSKYFYSDLRMMGCHYTV